MTLTLHQGFIDAASKPSYTFPAVVTNKEIEIENDRLRHIRLHERVNDLPDANYATLKYFLGHLHRYVNHPVSSARCSHHWYRISQFEAENSMSLQNLAIVFGPTLFGQMAPSTGANGQAHGGMADAAHQNKVCNGR